MILAVHHDDNDSGFVCGLVDRDILADQTIVLQHKVLQANILQRFEVNPAALRRFLVASCDNELHERVARNLNLQPLSASHIHYMCQVFLRSELVEYYTKLRRHMFALIGTAVAGKTQTTMSLIARTFCILEFRRASAINLETPRRRWMDHSACGRRNKNYDLTNTVRRAHLPKILLVASTNNVMDVGEEQ